MRKSDVNIVIFAAILIVIVAFLYYQGAELLDLTDANRDILIYLIIVCLAFFVSAIVIAKSRGVFRGAGVIGFGLVFAYLINLMNENDILIPDLETSAPEVIIIVILVFVILGILVAVAER